MEKKYKQVM